MRSSVLLLTALVGAGAPPTQAATLGDLARALTRRDADTRDHGCALDAIEGVQWRNRQTPGGSFAREGSVTLADFGPATVVARGARHRMFDVQVSVTSTIDAKTLGRTLRSQFPGDARFEFIRDRSSGKRAVPAARVYRVTLKGREPLYVGVLPAPDGKAGRQATVFVLASEIKPDWTR